MRTSSRNDTHGAATTGGSNALPTDGASPYATAGGGITFERKVAVKYLALMLAGDGATELGDGRIVVRVAFQQAPTHSVDDLVVSASHPDELEPSLILALAIRRSPSIVQSDVSTRKLIRQFVLAVINEQPDGPEYQLGLVVAGPQKHAKQLAQIADLAEVQSDASGLFNLVRTPSKFGSGIRARLSQLEKLVGHALHDLNVADTGENFIQERTWQLLSRLTVLMPRVESPDETDWDEIVNRLKTVASDSDLAVASQIRDRLVALADDYAPRAACVDVSTIRRDAHALLDTTKRGHQRDWQTLQHMHRHACESVRDKIVSNDRSRSASLDRRRSTIDILEEASRTDALVVSGESGVGKSALAVLGLSALADAEPKRIQVLCINLRQVPASTIDIEGRLRHTLSELLSELSAPQRILAVDGADAVTEDKLDVFRYLVGASKDAGVRVIAVTSLESKQVVLDTLREQIGTGVSEYVVPLLSDSEIDELVGTFPELARLNADSRSRELLRRLVVVDLLIRGQVSGTPLTDADAMNEVWTGLVRRHERSDRGSPDARETALLRLAELELDKGERLGVISAIDPAALDGLRRDGLVRTSSEAPFMIGPEFTHDEIRRYAIARLLLASENPASRLLMLGAPRWSLAAARLACQAWLAQPDTSAVPQKGRFVEQQASFDALIEAGHASRWSDVPAEALLKLANPAPLLQDAWPDLLGEGSAGLRRLVRLINQRHKDKNGVMDVVAAEPVVTLLLGDPSPWRIGKYVRELIRSWLHAHVLARTEAGHPLRILLRKRLVEACADAERRHAEEQAAIAEAQAARTPEEVEEERRLLEQHQALLSPIGYGGRRRRQRPKVPREITDKIVLELLALLGPDIAEDGEAILRRVAKDAPSWLAPAVEEPLTGQALVMGSPRLLAELTAAYYLDDEFDEDILHDYGVRRHRWMGLAVPHCAWYRGPFFSLFRTDFRNGVAVLNRLLNHAAQVRARSLASHDQGYRSLESVSIRKYQHDLNVTGTRLVYVGDEHVWFWYRGTGVGPYPCMSALQALERICDQLVDAEVPVRSLVSILLDGCKNLAMVGLVVGLLVRHLEKAGSLLDTCLTEPFIWRLEFARCVNEISPLAASSDGLLEPDRRKWSFREVSMFMVLRASDERAAELRSLGESLVANARRTLESTPNRESSQADSDFDKTIKQEVAQVRGWASCLDRERYSAQQVPEGVQIQATPPDDVQKTLQEASEDIELERKATSLFVRYHIDCTRNRTEVVGPDELAADIATAKNLLESPPSLAPHNPWEVAALVSAAALEAHLLQATDLPKSALSFATEILLQIGEAEATSKNLEFAQTMSEYRANRSAARAIPLLLLPVAARLRTAFDEEDGSKTLDRAVRAVLNLARAVDDEVRLHLARGLDPLWNTQCVDQGRCHHELGWQITTESMRRCVRGGWDTESAQRRLIQLEEPLTESLLAVPADSILVSRLDGAIRALAPAAAAGICVSAQARELLLALLAAQRQALLAYERGSPDERDTHSLVSARALMTLAKNGPDAPIFEQLSAFADNSTLLEKLLRALSAAAEETLDRAATAKRIWPDIIHHVLELNASGHKPFQGARDGDMALAVLIPNQAAELPYLYREVNADPIVWWDPLELARQIEAWLVPAVGNPRCVDQLPAFVYTLDPEEQVQVVLPWVAKIVLPNPARIASKTYGLADWLIEIRGAAADSDLIDTWQQIVDALVVAGETKLAPYSD